MSDTTTIPVPKHAIGDTVFVAEIHQTKRTLPCPDCGGTRKWKAVSPAGREIDMDCPRCAVRNHDQALSLERIAYAGRTRRLTVGSVTISTHVNPGWGDEHVRYMCNETGVGSGTTYNESRLHATEDAARAEAASMAAERNAADDAREAVQDAAYRASLGYFDAVRHGLRSEARNAARRELNDEWLDEHPECEIPGPLSVHEEKGCVGGIEVRIEMPGDPYRKKLCEINGDSTASYYPTEAQARGAGRLFAAAPDLLAACKVALADRFGGDDPCCDADPVTSKLRAAIARATGKESTDA